MISLYLVSGSLLLLVAFGGLVSFETRRGERILSKRREAFDVFVSRMTFIVEHVDLAAFFKEETVRIAHQIGHDIAHWSLQSVRAVERLLTRAVRHLRVTHAVHLEPKETSREFVKTMSDFKGQLTASRPEVLPNMHETDL